MHKVKEIAFVIIILFFLLFSFYPTIFELSNRNNLADRSREFILEHNYYWPDYNLYLSKIRQGFERHLTAVEKYTSERHTASLIQEFYVILGLAGRFLGLDPNSAYLLGRIVFSALLFLVILKLVKYYFPTIKTFITEERMGDARRGAPFSRRSEYLERARNGAAERQDPKRESSDNSSINTNYLWQIIAFLIIVTSGSFPRLFTNSQGILQVGRYMEWWSNIDALQRITFIPHILFGQVISFYLLYQLTMKQWGNVTMKQLIFFIFLSNILGLTFPPSLITLDGVILLIVFIKLIKKKVCFAQQDKIFADRFLSEGRRDYGAVKAGIRKDSRYSNLDYKTFANFGATGLYSRANSGARKFYLREKLYVIFIIFSLPSLLYIFLLTKTVPWSALVTFHRTHPMMIPFWEYILGTGPIFFLGLAGAVLSVVRRDRKFFPLIYWVLVTFFFAIFFTHVRDQSPLRFTQTGLFIPLGILGTYFFQYLFKFAFAEFSEVSLTERQTCGNGVPLRRGSTGVPEVREIRKPALAALSFSRFFEQTKKWEYKKIIVASILAIYIAGSLYMMKTSLIWQTTWITQRLRANIPPVPYPPQAMYPLKNWMDGIRWLRDKTDHNDVVLAQITAGNYIPAYSGNTVYFGQANTYDYERKQLEVNRFFKGEMGQREAELFLINGRIKYVFESLQEKEMSGGKPLKSFYPFLKPIYTNPIVSIYSL